MTDFIVGAVSGYTYDKIRPWVESIKKTGFEGRTVLITYNTDDELYDHLVNNDVLIVNVKDKMSMVDRFRKACNLLGSVVGPHDNIIWTDVRDVVFQTNPSVWIEENLFSLAAGKKIIVGSENLTYEDEPWGNNNMIASFGEEFLERVLTNPINCAGVIAGRAREVLDLFFMIYTMCKDKPAEIPGGGGPDQAALNIILSMEPYRSITKFCTTDDSWVCHLGTSSMAIEAGSGGIGQAYKHYGKQFLDYIKTRMVGGDPRVNSEGEVVNPLGVPYCIVHQYDRINVDWNL